MKMTYGGIKEIFDTDINFVNTVVIENQQLFTEICSDIQKQIQGLDGKTVVSCDEKPVDISKYVELLIQYIPFEINKKNLLGKLSAQAEKVIVEPDYYEETMQEIANLENYLWKIIESMEGNIVFSKLTPNNIIKAVGMEFEDDYASLGEKIIDYMELVRAYDKDKLFILANLRSFISDSECYEFFDTILRKQIHVIAFDNCEHALCTNEKRLIIDSECCEIK